MALALSLLTGGADLAAQERAELPESVQGWLEADQMQRWGRYIQAGDSLFNNGSCRRCHGDAGVGTQRAPDLTDSEWGTIDGSLAEISETIFWGVRRAGMSADYPFQMNPEGGMDLDRDKIRSIAAYVWSLSNGTHLPERGRP